MDTVAARDISVVLQGPFFDGLTAGVVASVHEVLPGAEIVLSTWKGLDLAHLSALDIDQVLLSEDPGGMTMDDAWLQNPRFPADSFSQLNLNRQIVSAVAGLKAARRPYAMKLRTDTRLMHDGFRHHFRAYPYRRAELALLGERLVALAGWNPLSCVCFCPADFAQFGRREDVLDLWDIPLVPSVRDLGAMSQDARDRVLLNTEQYIWVNFLAKKGVEFDFPHQYARTPELLRLSEVSIANNLIYLNASRFGLRFMKHRMGDYYNDDHGCDSQAYQGTWLYRSSYWEWLRWYQALAAPAPAPPLPAGLVDPREWARQSELLDLRARLVRPVEEGWELDVRLAMDCAFAHYAAGAISDAFLAAVMCLRKVKDHDEAAFLVVAIFAGQGADVDAKVCLRFFQQAHPDWPGISRLDEALRIPATDAARSQAIDMIVADYCASR
jgi:hypothetical protein